MSKLTEEQIAFKEKHVRYLVEHGIKDEIMGAQEAVSLIDTIRSLQAEANGYEDGYELLNQAYMKLQVENAQLREAVEWSETRAVQANQPEIVAICRQALRQPSKAYERYQAMRKVYEEAKKLCEEEAGFEDWGPLAEAIDELEEVK